MKSYLRCITRNGWFEWFLNTLAAAKGEAKHLFQISGCYCSLWNLDRWSKDPFILITKISILFLYSLFHLEFLFMLLYYLMGSFKPSVQVATATVLLIFSNDNWCDLTSTRLLNPLYWVRVLFGQILFYKLF